MPQMKFPQFDSANRSMQILDFGLADCDLAFKKITPFSENKFGKPRMTVLVTDDTQKVLDDIHRKVLNMSVTVYSGLTNISPGQFIDNISSGKFSDLIDEPNSLSKPIHRNGFLDVGPATGRSKMIIAHPDGSVVNADADTINDELNRLTPHKIKVRVSVWSRHDGEKYVFGYFTQLLSLIY